MLWEVCPDLASALYTSARIHVWASDLFTLYRLWTSSRIREGNTTYVKYSVRVLIAICFSQMYTERGDLIALVTQEGVVRADIRDPSKAPQTKL
jgi:hypothetical protein